MRDGSAARPAVAVSPGMARGWERREPCLADPPQRGEDHGAGLTRGHQHHVGGQRRWEPRQPLSRVSPIESDDHGADRRIRRGRRGHAGRGWRALGFGQNLGVQGDEAFRDDLRAKPASNRRSQRRGIERLPTTKGLENPVAESQTVVDRHQRPETLGFSPEDLGDAARVRRDDGQARGERLGGHDSERLVAAGMDEHARSSHRLRDLRSAHHALERHPIGNVEASRDGLPALVEVRRR